MCGWGGGGGGGGGGGDRAGGGLRAGKGSGSVWGWFGRAYKAPRFQSGPGEMQILNSDWPLGWEAVSEEMR